MKFWPDHRIKCKQSWSGCLIIENTESKDYQDFSHNETWHVKLSENLLKARTRNIKKNCSKTMKQNIFNKRNFSSKADTLFKILKPIHIYILITWDWTGVRSVSQLRNRQLNCHHWYTRNERKQPTKLMRTENQGQTTWASTVIPMSIVCWFLTYVYASDFGTIHPMDWKVVR